MTQIFSALMEIESRSARLDGVFQADPFLARLWRAQAALTEACRSVSMEDIHVLEGDVIHHGLENKSTSAETSRGISASRDILKALSDVMTFDDDPDVFIRKIIRSSVAFKVETSTTDTPPSNEAGVPAFGEGDINKFYSAYISAPCPFIAALHVTALFRDMTEGWSPSVERTLFMRIESSYRFSRLSKTGFRDTENDEHLINSEALDGVHWTMTPATALTSDRYLTWSPGSVVHAKTLMQALIDELGRSLGALPRLRHWREKAYEISGRKARSSALPDLIQMVSRRPILTSGMVRDHLGISDRSALYLMAEAEASGILTLITPRRSSRVWALPYLAEKLRQRVKAKNGITQSLKRIGQEHAHEESPGADRDSLREEVIARKKDREDRDMTILSELDEAIAKADRILAKYNR